MVKPNARKAVVIYTMLNWFPAIRNRRPASEIIEDIRLTRVLFILSIRCHMETEEIIDTASEIVAIIPARKTEG